MTDTQVPHKRKDSQLHPTPTEIHIAIMDALICDASNPDTPAIPSHIGGLVRSAIEKANRGEYE